MYSENSSVGEPEKKVRPHRLSQKHSFHFDIKPTCAHWGATKNEKQGSRGRGVKDSSERQGSKTFEPSNPGILEPYFRINRVERFY